MFLGVLLLVERVSAFFCVVFWVGVLETGFVVSGSGVGFQCGAFGVCFAGSCFRGGVLGVLLFGVSGWWAGVFACDFWRVCVLFFFLWWVFRFYGWRGRADFGGVGWGGVGWGGVGWGGVGWGGASPV